MLSRPALMPAQMSRSMAVRLASASAHPRLPHPHTGPSASRIMCPTSAQALRHPCRSSPPSISPPPSPVPTKIPDYVLRADARAEGALAVGAQVHIILDEDRQIVQPLAQHLGQRDVDPGQVGGVEDHTFVGIQGAGCASSHSVHVRELSSAASTASRTVLAMRSITASTPAEGLVGRLDWPSRAPFASTTPARIFVPPRSTPMTGPSVFFLVILSYPSLRLLNGCHET